MTYTVAKRQCEMYEFRFNDRWDWAFISLDESNGIFQAYSSYGTYGYSWSNHGRESFKHFILEVIEDPSYFLRKVAKPDYFDEELTKEKWLQQICRDRYPNDDVKLGKEEARDLYDGVKEEEFYSAERAMEFIFSNETISKCYGCEPWYAFEPVVTYSPDVLGFAKLVLPMLGEVLKKELMIEEEDVVEED